MIHRWFIVGRSLSRGEGSLAIVEPRQGSLAIFRNR